MDRQNANEVRFSLKYKILLILISLSVSALGVFLYISISHFTDDKRNYLLEGITQITGTEAEILNREVDRFLELTTILAQDYDPQTLNFSAEARKVFDFQKSVIKAQLVEFQGSERRDGSLLNKSQEEIQLAPLPFYRIKEVNSPKFICDADEPTRVIMISRVTPDAYRYFVAEMRVLSLGNLMEKAAFQFSIYCGDNERPFIPLSSKVPPLNEAQAKSYLDQGSSFTKELILNGSSYLMSASLVQGTSIRLMSFVDTEKAMKVIKDLQRQAIYIFVAILGVVATLALLISAKLTGSLEQLTQATRKVAAGDFEFPLHIGSSDEVSVLAKAFDFMRERIRELLERTKQTARMEAELETANLVQSTLFPKGHYSTDGVEILGRAASASECGGDLWHYYDTEEKVYLFIGDVVGHGVPSALMTTAARSVTAILELQQPKQPDEILLMLNQAIYETSKGKMWMTFFVGILDKKTGAVIYSNASHNPPFIFKNREKIKKSDVELLLEEAGPSLGRQKQSQYKVGHAQLDPGDLILFYTDGLTECANPSSEQLGEVRLVKTLVKSWNQNKSLNSVITTIEKDVESFRSNHPYEDDITYFAVKWSQ